ncbi:MAG TPA: hypothetical protein DC064_27295 [Cyanobacteria bacterium UBA9273]|nr:hypothetical protein [Cyanobacteria bacterium UBA9273]
MTSPPTPLLQGEGSKISGSPFPCREGGWGVRFFDLLRRCKICVFPQTFWFSFKPWVCRKPVLSKYNSLRKIEPTKAPIAVGATFKLLRVPSMGKTCV